MTAARRPTAPADLAKRGRAFWRTTTRDFVLTSAELETLREACRTLDEIEDLKAVVTEDGVMATGSTGQTVVHPAVAQLRAHRLALGRLLAQLALPDEHGLTLLSPERAKAQAAAHTRWGARGTA